MIGGYMSKLLFVDLTTRTVEVERPREELYESFLGGYGIGVKVLFTRMERRVDPLGPENILGFVTGPLTGTPALIASRYTVVGKSPLTSTWGDSNSGGYFGPMLKFAGYDGVFITGMAESPVWIFIDRGNAEFRDASHLWGKDTFETEDLIKDEVGDDVRVACIGPGGEKCSLIACVMNDKGRAAGRSGLGAVMGSKRLKAIAVRGELEVPVADIERVKAVRRKFLRGLKTSLARKYKSYGTCGGVEGSVTVGDAPVKNWMGSPHDFPHSSLVSDERVIKYQSKKFACWRCPLGCGGHVEVPHGRYAVHGAHKPEYETLVAFGPLCLNDNLESIIKANDLCNRYGLDTISTGSAVAFAIECYEKGLLTRRESDGLDLSWGNHEAIVELTEKIGKREGLGRLLADGTARACEAMGRGVCEFASDVQGQELPMLDPRYTPGLTVAYQMDATPGRHTQGIAWAIDLPTEWKASLGLAGLNPEDRYVYRGKGRAHWRLANIMHVVNSSGICLFGFISGEDTRHLPAFLSAVTGRQYDLGNCYELGERIGVLRLLFNLREGMNPLDFKFPERALGRPPLEDGPIRRVTIDHDGQLRDYLKAARLDPHTAMPSMDKLAALGLVGEAKAI
jgi:aldehyde:ferredoxin oxidoreductase